MLTWFIVLVVNDSIGAGLLLCVARATEMEVTIIGLQNAGKTSLLHVLAVCFKDASTPGPERRMLSQGNAPNRTFRATSSRLSKDGSAAVRDDSLNLAAAPFPRSHLTKRKLKKVTSLSNGELLTVLVNHANKHTAGT